MDNYKILIVEDNLIIANSIRSVLTKNGYEVISITRSGEDAIELLKTEQPHLVLMDISLKGNIDGVSTAKIINRNYNIPIVFITQHTNRDIFLNAKETAPKNYITKPFTSEELVRAVDLAIGDGVINAEQCQLDTIDKNTSDGVFIHTKENAYEKLLFSDLLYIESVGAYSKIYFERNGEAVSTPYIVSISSNHVAAQMGCPDIIKVHRSYYVNIRKINKINNNKVFIKDIPLPLSDKIKVDLFNNTFNILRKP